MPHEDRKDGTQLTCNMANEFSTLEETHHASKSTS